MLFQAGGDGEDIGIEHNVFRCEADLVDQKPDRQLSRDRGDAGDGQRKAQFDKADAERRLQEREQWRQNQTWEMLDEVRGRNDRDRAGFAPSPAASRPT